MAFSAAVGADLGVRQDVVAPHDAIARSSQSLSRTVRPFTILGGTPILGYDSNLEVMMRVSQALSWMVVVVLVLTGVSCAADRAKQEEYSTFLSQVAKDCKPLVIGSDDIGQAIIFNGLGAVPENYTNFLDKTKALYFGALPADTYRNSLTAFIGTGSYNDRSFACIIAHVPKK
jgi:hypothetical protein